MYNPFLDVYKTSLYKENRLGVAEFWKANDNWKKDQMCLALDENHHCRRSWIFMMKIELSAILSTSLKRLT